MNPPQILKLEAIALTVFCGLVYQYLGGNWWMFAILFLAPDVVMLGYLAGNKIGANLYNLFHTQTVPIALLAFGLVFGSSLLMQVSVIWFAHICFDRAVGYGLKLPTGFKQTHLSS